MRTPGFLLLAALACNRQTCFPVAGSPLALEKAPQFTLRNADIVPADTTISFTGFNSGK